MILLFPLLAAASLAGELSSDSTAATPGPGSAPAKAAPAADTPAADIPAAGAPQDMPAPEAGPAPDQQELLERVEMLELQLDAVTSDMDTMRHGSTLVPPVIGSEFGLGPSASKIYQQEAGDFSIGGYGEFRLEDPAGDSAIENADAQRVILYFGQRFHDKWLLNSELEFEHGSTAGDGSVSVEFAYIDYMASQALSLRGGVVLIPMGFINELHEPNTFLPVARPETEKRIIPSTWRENGVGIYGESSGFSYRAYVVNGLDGEDFSSNGLRGGRQRASEAKAEDVAFTGRIDYVDVPGLTLGASLYHGDSAQDLENVEGLTTTIYDVHAEYQAAGWQLRGLFAGASLDGTDEFNAQTGEELSSGLDGWYLEAGYDLFADVFPVSGQSLSPYVRYESIDTGPGNQEITTIGLNYKPINEVVFKLDYQDWAEGDGNDALNFLIGYVF